MHFGPVWNRINKKKKKKNKKKSKNFLPEIWIFVDPSALSVTETLFSVLLPHFGQNSLDTSGTVLKQA